MRTTNHLSVKPALAAIAMATAATLLLSTPAHAIKVKVTGAIIGKNVTFDGMSDIGIVSLKGPVTGTLSTGEKCRGNASLDKAMTNGKGSISCGKLSASFTFTLSSRVPPRGSGGGKTNNGDTITFNFGN